MPLSREADPEADDSEQMLLLTGGLFRSNWLVEKQKQHYGHRGIIIPNFGDTDTGTR